MKSKSIISVILCAVLILPGCSSKQVNKEANSDSKNNIENKTTTEKKYYAPYTGEEVTKEAASKPAYLAIIENAPAARPQSGFTEADIVYEAMAEGGITRCIALYQKEDSPKIGPIRSARTYFIDIAYEYNLPFAHCGGSHDALDRIKNEKPMSMNEMYNSSFFWRDKAIKVQEHSLYTSSERLRDLTVGKGYDKNQTSKLKFDEKYWDNLTSSKASNVTVKFNGSYTTAYALKDGLYYKSMNNKATENKEDKKPVAVKNIVIQNVNYKTRPKEAYLDADLIGQGDGYIISEGKSIKVTWSRADLKSQTIFKDEQGKVVSLNPGKTWWHLLDQNAKLTIAE